MKKFTLILVVVVAVCSTATFAAIEASPFSYSLSLDWASKYVASGSNFYDNPVLQQSFTISHDSGYYFNIFHNGECSNEHFDNENCWASEIDYTPGWAGNIGGFDVDFNFSYWDAGKLFDKGCDVFNTNLRIGKTYDHKNQSFNPFVQFSDYRSVNSEPWDGFRLFTGLNHSWKVDDKLSINSEVSAMYDDGAFECDSGFIGKFGTSLNWQISKNVSMTLPRITIYTPLQRLSDERKTEVIFGTGLTFTF